MMRRRPKLPLSLPCAGWRKCQVGRRLVAEGGLDLADALLFARDAQFVLRQRFHLALVGHREALQRVALGGDVERPGFFRAAGMGDAQFMHAGFEAQGQADQGDPALTVAQHGDALLLKPDVGSVRRLAEANEGDAAGHGVLSWQGVGDRQGGKKTQHDSDQLSEKRIHGCSQIVAACAVPGFVLCWNA